MEAVVESLRKSGTAEAMTDAAASGKRDFFVSFTQADRAWAAWIAWVLEEKGYSAWFQDWDFKGNFVLEMDKAHTQSRRTLAVLSPDYLASRFTASEWAARFAQDATSEHDLLISVRVRPCELEGLLAQIVYVDLVGCDEAAAKKRLLDRVSGIRAKPDEPPLYPNPSKAGHTAVPKRPDYPGVVRAAGRWLHQALIGGGIAAAVVGALLTWWLGAAPTQTSVNLQNQGGQIGPVVTGPIAGDVIGQQTTVYGVPLDKYERIRDELGVTDEALASFFAIVERKRVPRHELEPTLQEIARRYKELLARLETTGSTDPEVQRLKKQARKALRVLDFGRAEELLNQAKARDLSAIEWMEADLDARKLSAAEAAAETGDLMMTQIRYADAARYYAEAVGLTPEKYVEQLSVHLTDWASALYDAGDYRSGLDPARRALALDEARLPASDARLANQLNNLAVLYQASGRNGEAEQLYKRALTVINAASFGSDHPISAILLNNLAGLYLNTARPAEAEPLLQHAITLGNNIYGIGRDEFSAYFTNFVPPREATGSYTEAEPLKHVRVITIHEKVLNLDDPSGVTAALNNLAINYQMQSRYAEAEPLYGRVIALGEKMLGPEHPRLTIWLNNLAALYQVTGRHAEAEPLYRRALSIFEKALPADHPNLATVRKNYMFWHEPG